ncbi:MAG: CPBP family intramembrane metalloprotease [Lachnospiraceae bacterium]|nr:CPBP family intramembrane metalloprotease [Lachnospiraceae bacterium]
MKKENILKTIAASLGFFIVLLVSQALVPLAYQGYCYFAYSEMRTTNYDAFARQVSTLMQDNSSTMNVLSLALFLVIIFMIFKIKRMSLLTRIRWNPVSKQIYVFAAVFAIFNLIAFNLLSDVLFPQSWVQGAEEYATAVSGDIFYTIMFIVIFTPLVEEILMRGLITTRLLKRLPLWFAVAFPAILFGLGHGAGGMGQIIGTTVLGLLFALVFIWTNSLRTAVLAHMLNNLLAAYLPWSAINEAMGMPVQLTLGIIALAISVFFGYMIYKKWDRESLED